MGLRACANRGGLLGLMSTALITGLSACFVPDANLNNAYQGTPTPSPTVVVPGGAKTAKVIFLEGANGSFDTYSGNGTPSCSPTDCSVPATSPGFPATRIFDGANNLIANATTEVPWLTGVYVAITGNANYHEDGAPSAHNLTDNTASPVRFLSHPNCARFANSSDPNRPKCQYGGDSAPFDLTKNFKCVPDGNYYRVSEIDCVTNTIPAAGNVLVGDRHVKPGDGGALDQVFIRAYFSNNSAYLGTTENIIAVVEYQAAGLKAGLDSESDCYNGGAFDDTRCSDQIWQAFVKNGNTGAPSPLALLVPPASNYHRAKSRADSYGIITKQLVIPISSYRGTGQDITVLQLSRKGSTYTKASTFFEATCNTYTDSTGTMAYGNSPLCVGVVLRSITFMRM